MRPRKLIVFGFAFISLFMTLAACRTNAIQVNVTYAHLTGLAEADRVLFEGNAAGTVDKITYLSNGTYVIVLQIDKGFANALTNESEFYVIDDVARQGHKAVAIRLQRTGGTPLADGSTVAGATPEKHLGLLLHKELSDRIDFMIKQIDRFKHDLKNIPQSEAYRKLQKTMQELTTEILRSEKAARQRIKRDWLPKLEKELDKLRQHLRQFNQENELQPLEEEVERIRRI